MDPTTAEPAVTTQSVGGADQDMGEIVDFFPTPAFIVSPSYRIQRVSSGLLKTWHREEDDFLVFSDECDMCRYRVPSDPSAASLASLDLPYMQGFKGHATKLHRAAAPLPLAISC